MVKLYAIFRGESLIYYVQEIACLYRMDKTDHLQFNHLLYILYF
jgi:hypothetical protein